MLSVAGQAEEAARRPAAGAANGHLDAILTRLHAARPDIFPYAEADSYTLLNAHPGIEYAALTGRTEAPSREYVTPGNIDRVRSAVGARPVVAFGARARRTCRAAGIRPVATGRHPSSLNRMRDASIDAPTPAARASQRYDIAALQMLRTIAA